MSADRKRGLGRALKMIETMPICIENGSQTVPASMFLVAKRAVLQTTHMGRADEDRSLPLKVRDL
jgi:hypothetical protein